jgi:hypothetical protein
MSNQGHCKCQRCTIRGLMGPVIVVTVGVLFLLAEIRGGFFDFSNTWPVILVVIGLVSLASSFASSDGHNASSSPVPPAIPAPQGMPPAPTSTAPSSSPGQGQ